MRKLISMMLMLCAIVTFSACSSDDDGPTNPITNAVVPSSAKIGSEVTVQGSGFATGQTILLQPESGDAVDVNAKVSSNGATFTIPYTLSTGKVNVVLKSGNDSWTLGSINLLDADNPISALSLPSEIAQGHEVTISGIGFAEGDKLFFASPSTRMDQMIKNPYVYGTVTADGFKFTMPNYDVDGLADVKLVRGNSSWSLGEAYIYQPRQIESITISGNAMMSMYASMIGLTEDALKLNLSYNEDGSLKAISSNSALEWAFAYDGKTVSTTGQTTGQPYTYTLDDNGRIAKSTGYNMYGDEVTYTWNYDVDGYLVSVKQDGSADPDFSCTYNEGNMAGYDLGFANELSTDKNLRVCPFTVEPIYLLNSFGLIFSREDLFIGFLINRDVKVSSFVPNQFVAGDMDNTTGETISNTAAIQKSFANNSLTLTTTGSTISGAQSLFANTVVVTYKNK